MAWSKAVLGVAIFAITGIGAPSSATAQAPAPSVCGWVGKDNPDLVNIAFPDEGAHYWGSVALGIPETGLILRGRYPDARYFSFNVYDATLSPTDSIADREIAPSSGVNPFAAPSASSSPASPALPAAAATTPTAAKKKKKAKRKRKRKRKRKKGSGKRGEKRGSARAADPAPSAAIGARASDGTWELRVLPGEPPADPPPNTIYTGSTKGVPNLVAIMLYRVYVSSVDGDDLGGAGLPSITVTAGGEEALPLDGCTLLGGQLPSTGINELIRELSYPGPPFPVPGATNPPVWKKFFSLDQILLDLFPLPGELRELLDSLELTSGGLLNNVDNSYISAVLSRQFGDLVVVRMVAPSFPDTRAGEPPTKPSQLRYWSMCQNERLSQRFVACFADYQSALDSSGRATFVVSDPDDRPANANSDAGVNWLPWGGLYPDGLLIYRQMLPDPTYQQAFATLERGEDLGAHMGAYLPEIAYCSKAQFEAAGAAGCLGAD